MTALLQTLLCIGKGYILHFMKLNFNILSSHRNVSCMISYFSFSHFFLGGGRVRRILICYFLSLSYQIISYKTLNHLKPSILCVWEVPICSLKTTCIPRIVVIFSNQQQYSQVHTGSFITPSRNPVYKYTGYR